MAGLTSITGLVVGCVAGPVVGPAGLVDASGFRVLEQFGLGGVLFIVVVVRPGRQGRPDERKHHRRDG